MSSYDQHPGGGYEEVKGYENPAGSMAEEAARMRDDEMRREQQAQADRDAAQAQAESQQQANAQQQQSRQQTRKPHGKQARKAAPSHKTGQRGGKASPGRAAKPAPEDINTEAALVAFVGIGAWAALGFGLEGNARWAAGLIAGTIAGYVAGRYLKQIVAGGLVIGGLWFFSNLETGDEAADDPDAYVPEYTYTPPAPAPTATPTPAATTPGALARALERPAGEAIWSNPLADLPPVSVTTAAPAAVDPTQPLPDIPSLAELQGLPELHNQGVLLTDAPTDFHLEAHRGVPNYLMLIHDAPLDLDAVERLGYSELYDQPVARMKNGQRFALSHPPLELSDEVRAAFQQLDRITVIADHPADPVTGQARTLGQRHAQTYELWFIPWVSVTLPAKP